MSIKVKFFAGLRDWVDQAETAIEADGIATAADVLGAALGEQRGPDAVLCAVNFETVSLEHPVADGDEVAFFPPVTGG